jgi:hypothetical protein
MSGTCIVPSTAGEEAEIKPHKGLVRLLLPSPSAYCTTMPCRKVDVPSLPTLYL